MRRLSLALVVAALSAGSSVLYADQIPYQNAGSIAPTNTLTASSTGDIMGYFYGASAGGVDYVRILDVTSGNVSDWYFNNQTTPVGTSQSFGHADLGDTLVIELASDPLGSTPIFASDPSYSADGINHAYVTTFSGNGTIPPGLFVGMEDLPNGSSDLDYNDDTFVFTTFTASSVPEPGSIALLGTGVLAAAGLIRRRILSA